VKITDYELKVKQGIDVAFEYHGFKGSKHEKSISALLWWNG
jgi:hypothetical protein